MTSAIGRAIIYSEDCWWNRDEGGYYTPERDPPFLDWDSLDSDDEEEYPYVVVTGSSYRERAFVTQEMQRFFIFVCLLLNMPIVSADSGGGFVEVSGAIGWFAIYMSVAFCIYKLAMVFASVTMIVEKVPDLFTKIWTEYTLWKATLGGPVLIWFNTEFAQLKRMLWWHNVLAILPMGVGIVAGLIGVFRRPIETVLHPQGWRGDTNRCGMFLTGFLSLGMLMLGPLIGMKKVLNYFKPIIDCLKALPFATWILSWLQDWWNGDTTFEDLPQDMEELKEHMASDKEKETLQDNLDEVARARDALCKKPVDVEKTKVPQKTVVVSLVQKIGEGSDDYYARVKRVQNARYRLEITPGGAYGFALYDIFKDKRTAMHKEGVLTVLENTMGDEETISFLGDATRFVDFKKFFKKILSPPSIEVVVDERVNTEKLNSVEVENVVQDGLIEDVETLEPIEAKSENVQDKLITEILESFDKPGGEKLLETIVEGAETNEVFAAVVDAIKVETVTTVIMETPVTYNEPVIELPPQAFGGEFLATFNGFGIPGLLALGVVNIWEYFSPNCFQGRTVPITEPVTEENKEFLATFDAPRSGWQKLLTREFTRALIWCRNASLVLLVFAVAYAAAKKKNEDELLDAHPQKKGGGKARGKRTRQRKAGKKWFVQSGGNEPEPEAVNWDEEPNDYEEGFYSDEYDEYSRDARRVSPSREWRDDYEVNHATRDRGRFYTRPQGETGKTVLMPLKKDDALRRAIYQAKHRQVVVGKKEVDAFVNGTRELLQKNLMTSSMVAQSYKPQNLSAGVYKFFVNGRYACTATHVSNRMYVVLHCLSEDSNAKYLAVNSQHSMAFYGKDVVLLNKEIAYFPVNGIASPFKVKDFKMLEDAGIVSVYGYGDGSGSEPDVVLGFASPLGWCNAPTRDGDCTSPVLDPNGKIVGFWTHGNGKNFGRFEPVNEAFLALVRTDNERAPIHSGLLFPSGPPSPASL